LLWCMGCGLGVRTTVDRFAMDLLLFGVRD
jgi:hypothetical protein